MWGVEIRDFLIHRGVAVYIVLPFWRRTFGRWPFRRLTDRQRLQMIFHVVAVISQLILRTYNSQQLKFNYSQRVTVHVTSQENILLQL